MKRLYTIARIQLLLASCCLLPALFGLYYATVLIGNDWTHWLGWLCWLFASGGFVLYYHYFQLCKEGGYPIRRVRNVWRGSFVYNLILNILWIFFIASAYDVGVWVLVIPASMVPTGLGLYAIKLANNAIKTEPQMNACDRIEDGVGGEQSNK
ncbi:MAG: hypothetical protein AAGF10_00850 [Verrucomicrobiota bacterium]